MMIGASADQPSQSQGTSAEIRIGPVPVYLPPQTVRRGFRHLVRRRRGGSAKATGSRLSTPHPPIEPNIAYRIAIW